jgi:hypothetical protein
MTDDSPLRLRRSTRALTIDCVLIEFGAMIVPPGLIKKPRPPETLDGNLGRVTAPPAPPCRKI